MPAPVTRWDMSHSPTVRISELLASAEAVVLGEGDAIFRIEIAGTYEIFTHQLFEVNCSSVANQARRAVTMLSLDLMVAWYWLW